MVDAQTLSIVFAGLSIGVAAIYYTLTLRNSQRAQQLQLETRQAQLFMQITNKWSDVEFKRIARGILHWEWYDFDDFKSRYIDDEENMLKFTTIGSYLEGIGILVHKGLVDVGLVDDLFSSYIIRFWEKFESVELEIRELYNIPQSAEWIEYLYGVVKEIALKQHPELREKEILWPGGSDG